MSPKQKIPPIITIIHLCITAFLFVTIRIDSFYMYGSIILYLFYFYIACGVSLFLLIYSIRKLVKHESRLCVSLIIAAVLAAGIVLLELNKDLVDYLSMF